MRVAVIEPVGGHGGMDYYDDGLCAALADRGVDVTLHTCAANGIFRQEKYPVKRSYGKTFASSGKLVQVTRYLSGTLKALLSATRSGARVVHFHLFNVGPLEVFNVLCAKAMGRRVILTIHDVESFASTGKRVFDPRLVYNLADGIIVHNKVSADELADTLGIRRDRLSIIPHGHYLHALGEVPTKQEARKSLALDHDAKVLLFFGQIKEVKGLDILLRAFAEIVKKYPNVRLIIAGRPWKTEFVNYQNLIDELDVDKYCVKEIRYIENEEVANFFKASDAVILPYKKIYQSGVLLHAMSFGCPVIASAIPGMQEIIDDEHNGLLFKSSDPMALARVMENFLDAPELAKTIANNATSQLLTRYSWEAIAEQTERVYRGS